jgi:hypothetical protein
MVLAWYAEKINSIEICTPIDLADILACEGSDVPGLAQSPGPSQAGPVLGRAKPGQG